MYLNNTKMSRQRQIFIFKDQSIVGMDRLEKKSLLAAVAHCTANKLIGWDKEDPSTSSLSSSRRLYGLMAE